MTTAGGIGHTLPFLIPSFYTAMVVAFVVVVIELLAISYDPVAVYGYPAGLGGRQGDDRRRAGAWRREF